MVELCGEAVAQLPCLVVEVSFKLGYLAQRVEYLVALLVVFEVAFVYELLEVGIVAVGEVEPLG